MKQLISKLQHESLKEEMMDFITFVEEEMIHHYEKTERDGFYQDILDEKPELREKIHHLSRDLELIKIIIDLMKKELEKDEINFQKLVDYSSSVTLINEIHSRDEEESLLK